MTRATLWLAYVLAVLVIGLTISGHWVALVSVVIAVILCWIIARDIIHDSPN